MLILKSFKKKLSNNYEFLCDHNDKVVCYNETFDAYGKAIKDKEFKDFIQKCVKQRGDAFSSNRETAAFILTCNDFGLFTNLF